jgi:hypothetical protein
MKQEIVMKDLRFAFLAALLGACPAGASPAGDIAGTWECRLPGVEYRNKPPILYIADTGTDQVSIEVDGFAREIYGRSEVLADQDGWFKVKPAQGQEFMIRPDRAAKLKTPSMGLRFTDAKGDYRCLRLPPSGVPAEVAPPASGEPSPAPSPEPSAAPAAEPAAPQGTPSEGASPKPNQ